MSEMVERVARAIIAEFQPRKVHEDEARQIARAAIEAMREPTEAMNWEGRKAVPLSDKNPDTEPPKDYYDYDWLRAEEVTAAWQAMIDEALK